MTRKGLVLCLAAIFAVGSTVPVLAQNTTLSPRSAKLSKKALAKAKAALRTARAAKRQARLAREDGAGAQQVAAEAKGTAAAALAAAEAGKVRSGVAVGDATTSSGNYVPLAGGPSVTVTVPASGLIEVWAQASIVGEGAVSLFEDGAPLAGQDVLCSAEESVGALFSLAAAPPEPVAVGTPAVAGTFACGTLGAPGPVLFQTTPGAHTYELRYASCGCEDPVEPVTFSERRLFVAPRP